MFAALASPAMNLLLCIDFVCNLLARITTFTFGVHTYHNTLNMRDKAVSKDDDHVSIARDIVKIIMSILRVFGIFN